jgi:hypothetical protein
MKNKKPPNAGRGRVRGVPNKMTGTVREILTVFVEKNAAGAQALYDRVSKRNPAKALEIFARVAEFVLPRLQRIEVRPPAPPLPNEVTDPNEAAAVYSRIMSDPSLDATEVQFEVPAPAQLALEPVAPAVAMSAAPTTITAEMVPAAPTIIGAELMPAAPLTEAQERQKLWETLGGTTPVALPHVVPHTHVPLADSRCPQCRNLWVQS